MRPGAHASFGNRYPPQPNPVRVPEQRAHRMNPPHDHQRRIVAAASRIDVSDVSSRLLFPTPQQGPWLPFRRYAETIATSRKKPGPHSHNRELVAVYVLEGNVDHEDGRRERTSLASGDVLTLTAGQETEHQLMIGKGRTASWVSLVLALPSTTAATWNVARLRPVRPPPAADGTIQTDLVGGTTGIRAETGLNWTEIEFVQEGTSFVHVGNERRAVAYVLRGPGSIENQSTDTGVGMMMEGVAGVALTGEPGFRVLLASVPCPGDVH
jgi:redox-sensitive bicupin YhaK (pirin superfamily)